MAQYNRLTNLKCKEVHRPDLEQYYDHLCSPNVAFTDMIDGDDISKNVKEIQDANIKLIQQFYNINRSFHNDILALLYTDVIRLSIWT
jgi:hypothetical protein